MYYILNNYFNNSTKVCIWYHFSSKLIKLLKELNYRNPMLQNYKWLLLLPNPYIDLLQIQKGFYFDKVIHHYPNTKCLK